MSYLFNSFGTLWDHIATSVRDFKQYPDLLYSHATIVANNQKRLHRWI